MGSGGEEGPPKLMERRHTHNVDGTLGRELELEDNPAVQDQPLPVSAPPCYNQNREKDVVICKKGHVMRAKVVRELWNRVMWWHFQDKCCKCDASISTKDAKYYCEECKYSLCVKCSTKKLIPELNLLNTSYLPTESGARRPPSHIVAGDIFLCGPDRWGIHHVVLCCGPMTRDAEAEQDLIESGMSPENEVFACNTIESNHGLKGQEILWYPARTFFARNRKTGEAALVADEGESEVFEIASNHVPVKLLLHPLRPDSNNPKFNHDAWNQALKVSAEASKSWALATGARAFFAKRESLDPTDYPTPESRQALLRDLKARWNQKPICTSVAIQVWQRYFKLDAGEGPAAADKAAQNILRFMPVLSDRTLPSAFIKALSKSGWVLRGNIDG